MLGSQAYFLRILMLLNISISGFGIRKVMLKLDSMCLFDLDFGITGISCWIAQHNSTFGMINIQGVAVQVYT